MANRLGRYAVLKHLASGGMADVLLARSDGLEGFARHVVLKRIKPEHAHDQRFIRMFLDEARVAATLHHQNVVQVHDVGEADGEYFIAMEYIHGEDARTLLAAASKNRAHIPLGQVLTIAMAAASGLHYAHERTGPDKRPLGIVHRDVSPSNVLVGYDGSVKIVDFGIAKAAMGNETETGSVKGKASYMSPEQCQGAALDRRTDVYALGVVLYELATTTRLFKGANQYMIMEQIVKGALPSPESRRPDLPPELSAVILKALHRDRDQRYATAEELRAALEQVATKLGVATSTSAMAAFMRQQFGARPEPWLEGAEVRAIVSEDAPTVIGEPAAGLRAQARPPGGTRTGSAPRLNATSSAQLPRATAATSTASLPVAAQTVAPLVWSGSSTTTNASPSASSTAVTDARLGWESQVASANRNAWTMRAVMIGGPLLLIGGVLLWQRSGNEIAAPTGNVAPAVTPIGTTGSTEASMPDLPRDVTSAVAKATADAQAAAAAAAAAAKPRPEPRRTVEPAKPRAHIEVAAPTTASLPPIELPKAPVAVPEPTPTPPPPAVAAPTPPPAASNPPIVALPTTVAPSVLDGNRVAGERHIEPDELTSARIKRANKEQVTGSFKLCVTPEGSVSSVTLLSSTGFPSYDQLIQNTIRSTWRYRPLVINGKATAACTAARFVYRPS